MKPNKKKFGMSFEDLILHHLDALSRLQFESGGGSETISPANQAIKKYCAIKYLENLLTPILTNEYLAKANPIKNKLLDEMQSKNNWQATLPYQLSFLYLLDDWLQLLILMAYSNDVLSIKKSEAHGEEEETDEDEE